MQPILSFRHQIILTDLMRRVADTLRISELTLGPVLDLLIRIILAKIFLWSGIVKITDWNTALYLATYEYPVSWMSPLAAAYIGVGIELIGSILLLMGLMTRFAALAMLALSIVIQVFYQPTNSQIFWIILLGWYVIMGAGPISLDHLFRGIKESALFLAKPLSNFFPFLKKYVGPIYILLMRLWIASILYVAGHAAMQTIPLVKSISFLHYQFQVSILNNNEAGFFIGTFSSLCALLLVVGLGTRIVALITLIAISIITMHIHTTIVQQAEYIFWILLLGLLFLNGPGVLSLDHLINKWLLARFPELAGNLKKIDESLPHIVIVGAGFGGISAARALRTTACRITMIDQHNFHLFQPLLYQVAIAGLSPADIAVPIRSLFRDQNNIRIMLGEVTGVDKEKNSVKLKNDNIITYDFLILASGAQHSYFGKDEWAPFAPGLKRVEDAISIRGKLLRAFEDAENSDDPEEQKKLMTFVIVGGGPTGVELAGALAELAHQGMQNEFRNIDPAKAKIYLVEAGPRLLGIMPESLSQYTQASLEKLGVDVVTGGKVENITQNSVVVNGQAIIAGNIFWAAGVQASKAGLWIQGNLDRAGRLIVNKDLSVPGSNNIYAIGDTVLAEVWHGKPMPGLAPAAKQSGEFVAKQIRLRIEGRQPKPEFKYRHYGSLATVGRRAAVADFSTFTMRGPWAWWFWGAIHLLYLNNMRNRMIVMIQWFWAYLTFNNTTRLITFGENNEQKKS